MGVVPGAGAGQIRRVFPCTRTLLPCSAQILFGLSYVGMAIAQQGPENLQRFFEMHDCLWKITEAPIGNSQVAKTTPLSPPIPYLSGNAYRAVEGRAVVVRSEAKVVRRVFRWRAAGKSLRWMARKLNEEGIPTQHNKKWYPSTVWDLYRNRFYTGKSKFDGGWVEGEHEAVVSSELFTRANGHEQARPPRP